MKVVLVGPIQQENLALGYLASYARKHGHDVEIVAYAYRIYLDRTVETVLAARPDLVGLGIAFQNNIDDYVLLIRALRDRGYSGHLTCGGHIGSGRWRPRAPRSAVPPSRFRRPAACSFRLKAS
jgi:hypothetical protein